MKSNAFLLVLVLAACGGTAPPEPPPPEPTPVEHLPDGGIRLSPEAVSRLGVETTTVQAPQGTRTRTVAGFVTVPPGRALAVTAPVAGKLRAGDDGPKPGASVERGQVLMRLTPIAPVDRDLKAQARRQRAATEARVELAQARVDRLTKLLTERASSQRAIEEANAELRTATAEDEAAKARLRAVTKTPLAADVSLPILAPETGMVRTVSATSGQTVAAGAALFDVAPVDGLWVRVPVIPGELERIDRAAAVPVRRLGGAEERTATPVQAPPSADPVAATVDLYYALPADAPEQSPGERVMATLPYATGEAVAEIPRSALVYDEHGGAWVFVCDDDTTFRRTEVEVADASGGRARLRRAPAQGTCIVSVGAIELYGAEVGVSH